MANTIGINNMTKTTVLICSLMLLLANRSHAQNFFEKDKVDAWQGLQKRPVDLLPAEYSHLKTGRGESYTLSNSVQQEWVNYYSSGMLAGPDAATAVAADDSGNVYVTGYSAGLPFGLDYVTIKYAPTGDVMWTMRYSGEGNEDDKPVAICLDTDGNVYVTGQSKAAGTFWDYATVKYSNLGEQLWVARYNGPASSNDYPAALAVDIDGNIYVTGYSHNTGNNYDYATVKYNSSGSLEWAVRYDAPGNSDDRAYALAVDPDITNPNVYVTGGSKIDKYYDYATVKYNADGNEEWVVRVTASMRYDGAMAIVVDTEKNICVTGSLANKFTTIKYNLDGNVEWQAHAKSGRATAIALDYYDNVYVTGTDGQYTTIKYASTGKQVWVVHEPSGDVITDIVTDNNGNVYVTVKYNSLGERLWGKSYDSESDITMNPALTIDNTDYVNVVGQRRNDFITIKYNNDGVQEWDKSYDGSG